MRVALARLLLRRELRALERRLDDEYDRALSLAIDRVHVALEALS